MEVRVNKNESLIDTLIASGTSINDEYFYLPFWFELKGEEFILHKLGDNLPRDLESAIEYFREETKINDE